MIHQFLFFPALDPHAATQEQTLRKREMPSPLIASPSEVQRQLAHASDNASSQILVSHYICLPLATIAVILRLLSRYLSKTARLRADDYAVIIAWVIAPILKSNMSTCVGPLYE